MCLGGLFPAVLLTALLAAPAMAESAESCFFQVERPEPEQEVAASATVEGIALLPPGHHLWVFARRVDFAPRWWPQGEGVPDPSTGRWKVLATFGEPPDAGWDFDLAVAVFAGPEHAGLREWLAKAVESGEHRHLEMPAAVCPPDLRRLRKAGGER